MNYWMRYSWFGFVAASLSFQIGVANAASGVTAKDQPLPPITLPLEGRDTPASFKTLPSEEEVWRDYPKLANMMQLQGVVKVTCDVETDATVGHCVADSETPTGLGFAAGALHIASGFHLQPATSDGMPVKAKFTTSIRFKLPPAANVVDEPKNEPQVSAAKMALANRMISLQNIRTLATRSYETGLEQINQELEYSGKPSLTPTAMDAYRQGVQDALGVTLEQRARKAAIQLSETDLTAAVAFLESSAGQAWLNFNMSVDPAEVGHFQSRVGEAARNRYCAQVQCELVVGAPPVKPTLQNSH